MPVVRIDLEVGTDGTAKIKQVEGSLKDLGGAAKATQSILQGIGQGVGQKIFDTLKSIPSFLAGAMKAQGEAEAGINSLNLALANQGNFSKAASQGLLDYAGALSEVTTYSTGVIVQAQALGASFGMNEAQIKAATGVAADFAAATGKDLPAAMEVLGKAFVGQTGGLKKLGIVVDENASRSEKYAQVLDQLNHRFGGAAAAQAQSYAGQLKQLENATGDVQESVGKLLGELLGGERPFSMAIDFARSLAKFLGSDMVIALSEFRARWLEMLADISDPKGKGFVANMGKGLRDTFSIFTKGIHAQVGAKADDGGFADALRKEAAEIRKLGDAAAAAGGKLLTFNNNRKKGPPAETTAEELRLEKLAIDTMNKLRVDAIKTRNEQIDAEYKRGVKVVEQALDEWVEDEKETADRIKEIRDRLEENGEEFMDSWAEQIQREHDALMQFLSDLDRFGQALQSLGEATGSGFLSFLGGMVSGFAQVSAELANAKTNLEAYAIALQTAADIYNEGFKSKSTAKGALGGAAKGAAVGAGFGPIGLVAGGLIGAGIGILGAKKGQAAELAALNKEFDALAAKAKAAGVTLDHAFDPKNARSMKQAIADLKEAMDMKPLQDEFNELIRAAERAGITFDKTFDTSSADALKGSIDEIKRALDTNAEAQRLLNEALERYGFTIEEMGPALQRQKLNETAAQLYQDWMLLNAAGVDHNAMLERMGPAINEYVNKSVSAGVEIPAAMKPIIEDLFKSGKLIHENGDAYTQAEVDGITYAQTMSEMFLQLIAKVDELVSSILGIPNKTATVTVNRVYTGGPPPDDPDGGGGRKDLDFTRSAIGFHGTAWGPRLFLAGEAGPERVDIGRDAVGNGMTEQTGQALLNELRRMPKNIARSTKAALMMG